jgi:hypothetical protein
MKFFRKKDLLIIAIILIIAIGFWYTYNITHSDQSVKAEIYYYNELVMTIDLNQGIDKSFSIPQKPNVVFHLSKDGKISFIESDCPDKVCINTGEIFIAGQSAACLPNGLVLKIVSSEEDQKFDTIIGN